MPILTPLKNQLVYGDHPLLDRAAFVVAVVFLGLGPALVAAQERPPQPAEAPPIVGTPPAPTGEPTGYAGKAVGVICSGGNVSEAELGAVLAAELPD